MHSYLIFIKSLNIVFSLKLSLKCLVVVCVGVCFNFYDIFPKTVFKNSSCGVKMAVLLFHLNELNFSIFIQLEVDYNSFI